MTEYIRNPVQRRVAAIGSDYIGEQVVRLGNYSEAVETGVPGQYYARQHNGQVIRVINAIYIAPDFDARVLVRRSKSQPNVWRIVEALEDYLEPAGGGRLAYHHEQHEEDGPDRLTLDRKQIKQLSVRAAGGWKVQLYGSAIQVETGVIFVKNKSFDLTAYAITAGAKYVSIETDEAGDTSLNAGSVFSDPAAGTAANIPTPAAGKRVLAYILLHGGQTKIIDSNIRPVLPVAGAGIGHSHFNDAEGNPSDVSTSSSSDGSSVYAARRDHVHLYTPSGESSGGGGGGSHEHKLARWNGISGQTVFELPDFADSIERVELNGLIEDPLVYTLSSDGSQIVLDTALASDQTVSAAYIVRSITL